MPVLLFYYFITFGMDKKSYANVMLSCSLRKYNISTVVSCLLSVFCSFMDKLLNYCVSDDGKKSALQLWKLDFGTDFRLLVILIRTFISYVDFLEGFQNNRGIVHNSTGHHHKFFSTFISTAVLSMGLW